MQYFYRLIDDVNARGLDACVFPVTTEPNTYNIYKNILALRWDKCTDENIELGQWFILDLTTSFIRMLRHYLKQILHSNAPDPMKYYMENVKIFLSHSKHDCDGKTVAKTIRNCYMRTLNCQVFLMSMMLYLVYHLMMSCVNQPKMVYC